MAEWCMHHYHSLSLSLIKIESLESQKRQSFFDERIFEENKATQKIKTNSKYFFSYVKRFRQTSSTPNVLIDSADNTVTDKTEIANLFQKQFKSVFSDPTSPDIDLTILNSVM